MIARAAGFIAAAMLALGVEAAEWPVVAPVHRTFEVDGALALAIDVPILTASNSVAYVLSCRSDPDEISCRSEDAGEWLSSFRCTLNEKERAADMESSLLGEDESATWHSRGQFHSEELIGLCASYPEHGAHRTFRMRALQLELTASEVEAAPTGGLERFTFTVAVLPDPGAVGAQAEQTGYLAPMWGICRPVLRGNQPRMCRDFENLGGSWTDCASIGR